MLVVGSFVLKTFFMKCSLVLKFVFFAVLVILILGRSMVLSWSPSFELRKTVSMGLFPSSGKV